MSSYFNQDGYVEVSADTDCDSPRCGYFNSIMYSGTLQEGASGSGLVHDGEWVESRGAVPGALDLGHYLPSALTPTSPKGWHGIPSISEFFSHPRLLLLCRPAQGRGCAVQRSRRGLCQSRGSLRCCVA